MNELTYSQLLSLPEWKAKRNYIIDRDKKICQNCNNTSYTENHDYGVLWEHMLENAIGTKPAMIQMRVCSHGWGGHELYQNEIEMLNLPRKVALIFFFETVEEKYRIVACRTMSSPEIIDDIVKALDRQNMIALALKKRQHDNEKLKELVIKHHKNVISYWVYAYSLQVHHTYYQVGKLPWEYPEESMQTLCFKCHEELHKDENKKIEVRDSNGIPFAYYTPCPRCNGSGYLPQFKHVENGICFLCMDEKYLAPKFLKNIL